MEPLYEFKDSQSTMKWLIFAVGIMMLAMAVFLPDDPEVPIWLMWGIRVMLVFFGALSIIVVPEVKIRAFPDHVEIRYGLTKLISFNLDNAKIVSIEAIEYNPMKDFGGWGIKGGGGEWKGWYAFTGSISNKALAIETTEKNYILGCNNPEEAETMLKNVVGLK